MTEAGDAHPPTEADEGYQAVDDIPSNVPDPEAPLRGEDVPDDWLNPKLTTPSGRPGGW
jgi:hypothetical protein